VARKVRPSAREELLQLQFTTGADTIFEGIQRVLPGETLTCADGHIIERRRISPLPEGGPETIDEDAALKRLDKALEESVDLHQRSDVPYGMFLSGGIDSATLITLMARLNKDPVVAFTAGFDAPGAADERDHAAAVAKAVGAHHEAIEVNEKMVWEHLPEIVACMDDPAADYAIIPIWFLARRARQDVNVVLSGEGGDEIFGGYDRYRRAMYTFWKRSVPYPALLMFDTPAAEQSCVRRTRSNTPLQALTTLNEPTFNQAARWLAWRTLNAAPSDPVRATWAFRQCVSRAPSPQETAVLLKLLTTAREEYAAKPKDAAQFAFADPKNPAPLPPNTSVADLAAWSTVTRAILNLDETITKE
jgi:asparagine synthetase B (glutamine-hydrolysing)